MNLIRIITIGLIIYLVLRLYKQWAANKKAATFIHKNKEENMVRCEVCQLHITEKEALQHNGKFYCSQKHIDESIN